ncbi:hypothetical protein ABPG74_018714 [Tetrahymena malaccensis]
MGCANGKSKQGSSTSNIQIKDTGLKRDSSNQDKNYTPQSPDVFKNQQDTKNNQNLQNNKETIKNYQNAQQQKAAFEQDESANKYYQSIQKNSEYSITVKIISLLKQNAINENDIEKTKQDAYNQYKLMDDYPNSTELNEDIKQLEEKCKNYDNLQTNYEIKVFMIIFEEGYLKKLVQYIGNLSNQFQSFLKEKNVQNNILEYIEKEAKQLSPNDLRNCDSLQKEKFFQQFQKKLNDEIKKFQDKTEEKMLSNKLLILQILKARFLDSDDIDLRQLIQICQSEAKGQQEFITFVSLLLKRLSQSALSQSQLIPQFENNYNFQQNQINPVIESTRQNSAQPQVKSQSQQQQSSVYPSSSTLVNTFGKTFNNLNSEGQQSYVSSSQIALKITDTNQYELQKQNNQLQDIQQAEEYSSSQVAFQQLGNYKLQSKLNNNNNQIASKNADTNQQELQKYNNQIQVKQQADEYSSSQLVFQYLGNYKIESRFNNNNSNSNQNQQNANDADDLDTEEQNKNQQSVNQYFGEKIVSKFIPNHHSQLYTNMNQVSSNNNQVYQQNQNQELTACSLIQQYNLDIGLDIQQKIQKIENKLQINSQQRLSAQQILKDLGIAIEQK